MAKSDAGVLPAGKAGNIATHRQEGQPMRTQRAQLIVFVASTIGEGNWAFAQGVEAAPAQTSATDSEEKSDVLSQHRNPDYRSRAESSRLSSARESIAF